MPAFDWCHRKSSLKLTCDDFKLFNANSEKCFEFALKSLGNKTEFNSNRQSDPSIDSRGQALKVQPTKLYFGKARVGGETNTIQGPITGQFVPVWARTDLSSYRSEFEPVLVRTGLSPDRSVSVPVWVRIALSSYRSELSSYPSESVPVWAQLVPVWVRTGLSSCRSEFVPAWVRTGLSSYRSELVPVLVHTGLNSYRSEFVPVSCNQFLSLQRTLFQNTPRHPLFKSQLTLIWGVKN